MNGSTSILVVMLLSVGCSSTAAVAPPRPMPPPATAHVSIKLDDAQIIEVLEALDTQQVLKAQLAVDRAATEETRVFASRVLISHNEERTKLLRLQHQQVLALSPTHLIEQIEGPARETRAQLRTESGVFFDHAFLASEVTEKQKELEWLDHVLVPAAQCEHLRTELTGRSVAAAARIREAQRLARKL